MATIYKVVRTNKEGKFESCIVGQIPNHRHKFPELVLQYEVGRTTRAKIGLICCFRTLQDAINWLNYEIHADIDGAKIIKCTGRITRKTVALGLWVDSISKIEQAWKGFMAYGLLRDNHDTPPAGTVGCKEIFCEEIVYG